MPGIDTQIEQRMALGPQALQQRYAQDQQLVDLLALQKLSKDKADAARAIQTSMQNNPASVKDQLEQQLMTAEKEEVSRGIASMMPGVQQQGRQMAMAQQRPPMPQQMPQQRPPMPQGQGGMPQLASPNMARMAGGGIVSFQEGGEVDAAKEYIRLSEKLKDPNISPEAAQTITMTLEDMKRQAQDEPRFMLEIQRARDPSYDPVTEYEQSMQSQGGMYGGGIVGYAPGGFVGPTEDMLVEKPRVIRDKGIAALPTTQINPQTGTPESDTPRRKTGTELWNDFLWMFSDEAARQSRKRTGDILGREEYAGTGVSSVVDPAPPITRQKQVQEETPTTTAPATASQQDQEMSDAELEEILKMMEDPGSIREETAEGEGKRKIDMDALSTFLLGMGGGTSVAGALGGGGRAAQAERQRLEGLDREESRFAREIEAKKDISQQQLDMFKDELTFKRDQLTTVEEKNKFDMAQAIFDQTAQTKLAAWVAEKGEGWFTFKPNKQKQDEHMLEYFNELLKAQGLSPLPAGATTTAGQSEIAEDDPVLLKYLPK